MLRKCSTYTGEHADSEVTVMKKRILVLSIAVLGIALCACGSSSEVHVSADAQAGGDGSADKPYASIDEAVKNADGKDIIVHEGEYAPFEINTSGVNIKAAEGESVKIANDGIGIMITDASEVSIEGLEIEGGTHGIYYQSTKDGDVEAIENVTIKDCTVHGIRGTHGICVYAENPKAAVTGLKIDGCEVYDCETDSSESIVVNGNVENFEICNNIVHDNNNIGIDMIGFEETCPEPEVDCARDGICHDNVVYNISAEGNDAYLEDGEYDLCADGIYVDGGQNIEIYNNFIFNCDIGLEVATEHSPDDNSLYKVSGMNVHDNVVAGCMGWCGICFGGYDKDLGFTENSSFVNNTFVDNAVQVGVQRSKGNLIENNIFVGGDLGIEFNYDCAEEDLVNNFGENTWFLEKGNDFADGGDYDVDKMMPDALDKQTMADKRSDVIDGFKSLIEGAGSSFVPDDEYIKIYEKQVK